MADNSTDTGATTTGVNETAESNMEQTTQKEERRLRKGLMSKYPDFNAQTDEEWSAKEDEYYGEVEDELNTFKAAEAELGDVVRANPELANVLNDMAVSKMPFRAALAKYFSQEELIPVDGDDDYEAYEKSYNERLEKSKAREAKDQEMLANEAQSLDAIDAFAQENGLDEEGKTQLIEYINTFFLDMLNKKISPEMISMFNNAINYDGDVAAAKEAGEIKGRNAKIEAQIQEEEDRQKDDGIPDVSKGAEVKDDDKQGEYDHNGIFDFMGKRKRL